MTSIVKLPHGPSVPYSVVLNATRQTFERLASALSGQVCQVQILANGGQTAGVIWDYASKSQLVYLSFPSIPPHTILKRAEADRMVALLVHELMHVYATRKSAWATVLGERDPLLRDMVNALEDARIEALAIREGKIPAARELFADLNGHFLAEALANRFSMHKLGNLPYGLAILCRVKTGQDIPLARRIKGADHFKPAIRRALAGINRCRDTLGVVQLAREVVRLAREADAQRQQEQEQERQEQEQKRQQEQEQASQDPQDAQDSAQDPQDGPEGSDGPQDAQDPQDGPEGSLDGPEGSEGSQDPQDSGAAGSASQDAQDAPPYDPEATTREMFRRIAERTGETLGDKPDIDWTATQIVGWQGIPVEKPNFAPDAANAAACRASVPTPVAAKDLIRRKLRAPDTIATEHRLVSGRLDRRALSRIPAGARDVFSRRVETDATNVGVILILDGSTSMEIGQRHPMAVALGVHFAEACQHAGAESMVVAFTLGARLVVLKGWHDRTGPRVTAQIGGYSPNGSTPLTQSIMQAADMLARKPEFSRRIVMTLTDGGCNLGDQGVLWACRYAQSHGVEVIGVLLEPMAGETPSPTRGFPADVAVPVHDAADLSRLALDALAKALDRKPR